MRATFLSIALVASLALPAGANEGVDLSMKSKSAAAASTSIPASNAPAPFMRHARDPLPELMMRAEEERRGPAGACENGPSSLCYDVASGKIVYRGARAYMPAIDGLRAESVSLRRNRIVFKYSF
jgi:hypothetical protein